MNFQMKFVVAICFSAILYSTAEQDIDDLWEKFKATYGKSYKGNEEEKRKRIWKENVAMIEKHNLEYDEGKHSYQQGINDFTDMSREEILSTMTGFELPKETLRLTMPESILHSNASDLPDQVDWRDSGLVTNVKRQRACGACWAFSAVGSIEGQLKKKTGKLVSLSAQHLIDCSSPQGRYGCYGGSMIKAFQYVKDNGGINTEESYPYEAKNGTCRFRKNMIGTTLKGYVQITPGHEFALQQAVATIGPISVSIDASSREFQQYRGSSVFDYPNCNSISFNHVVLVVGYGSEDGKDYWLVKNSWGTVWGDHGYIKMSRNRDNQCGFARYFSYPIL